MPSIAVTRAGVPLSSYGEVTLIGDQKMIDPARSDNQVFDTDAYSQRMPEQKWKLNEPAR